MKKNHEIAKKLREIAETLVIECIDQVPICHELNGELEELYGHIRSIARMVCATCPDTLVIDGSK